MKDAETVRLLQAVWEAVGAVVGYLGWLWWGGLASMLAVVLGVVNAGLLWWVVRRMLRWEGAGK